MGCCIQKRIPEAPHGWGQEGAVEWGWGPQLPCSFAVLHAVVDRDQHYRILKFSPEERFTQERHIRRNAWKTFKLLRERWSPTNGPEVGRGDDGVGGG